MGRARKWPPTIYPHAASGQDRIRVGGHDYWLGPSGSEEAHQEYARLVVLLANPAVEMQRDADPTVTKIIAAWTAQDAPRLSPEERGNYARALRPLRAMYGSRRISQFGAADLRQLLLAMADGSWQSEAEKAAQAKHGKPVGWCRNVCNQRLVRIRTVFRWAEEAHLAPEGTWGRLRVVRGLGTTDRRVRQTAPRAPTDWESVEAVAPHCPEPVAAMLRLEYLSGMRPGEARILRLCDLDRTDPDCWLYRPDRHKTAWRGQERTIPLNRRCQEILLPWIDEADPTAYLFSPARYWRSRDRARARLFHDTYSIQSYARAVARACRRAGVKLIPYQCRHGAKRDLTRTQGLDAARAILGQKSLGTTNSYAAGIDLDHAIEASKKADGESGKKKI